MSRVTHKLQSTPSLVRLCLPKVIHRFPVSVSMIADYSTVSAVGKPYSRYRMFRNRFGCLQMSLDILPLHHLILR